MLRTFIGALLCVGLTSDGYAFLSPEAINTAKANSTNPGFQGLCDDYLKLQRVDMQSYMNAYQAPKASAMLQHLAKLAQ